MKKQILISVAITVSTLISAVPVLAQNDYGINNLINTVTKAQNQASAAAQRKATNLADLKSKADQMIAMRINDLNKISTRIQNDSRLNSSDKTSLNNDIQNATNGLTQLKNKIDADTDLTTIRADAQQIVTNYRVYIVLEPKIQLLITISNLQTLTANLEGLTPKIQSLVNSLQSQGKDVSTVTSILNNINSQLQTISTSLSKDKSTVDGVTITSTNPQATFTQVRQDLGSVRSEFAKIRDDIGKMRQAFIVIIQGTSNNPTTSTSSGTNNQ